VVLRDMICLCLLQGSESYGSMAVVSWTCKWCVLLQAVCVVIVFSQHKQHC